MPRHFQLDTARHFQLAKMANAQTFSARLERLVPSVVTRPNYSFSTRDRTQETTKPGQQTPRHFQLDSRHGQTFFSQPRRITPRHFQLDWTRHFQLAPAKRCVLLCSQESFSQPWPRTAPLTKGLIVQIRDLQLNMPQGKQWTNSQAHTEPKSEPRHCLHDRPAQDQNKASLSTTAQENCSISYSHSLHNFWLKSHCTQSSRPH